MAWYQISYEYQVFTFVSYFLIVLSSVVACFLGSRRFGYYAGAIGLVHTYLVTTVFAQNGFPILGFPVYMYLQLAMFLQNLSLVRPKLRGMLWRIFISFPGYWFLCSGFVGILFLPFAGWLPEYVFFIPFAISSLAVLQSIRTWRFENFSVIVNRNHISALQRIPLTASKDIHADSSSSSNSIAMTDAQPLLRTPLRLFQITDCHLGPFQSVKRLQTTCVRAMNQVPSPHLYLLTGDFFTMEAHHSADALSEALKPLAEVKHKVFACLGNHDYEALPLIKEQLHKADITLLEDEETVVDIDEVGTVQIVGLSFFFHNAADNVRAVLKKYPRRPGAFRLILLHNPTHFLHIEDGDADLVLSGHYHGGQVGFHTLGWNFTLLSLFSKFLGPMPDNGLWGVGKNLCYAHRGTGHYGFPLRLGVSSEESMLHVHWKTD